MREPQQSPDVSAGQASPGSGSSGPIAIITVALNYDYDLVAARRRARQIAALIGFDERNQTRIATVVSEIARNALRYAGGGRVEFSIGGRRGEQDLAITVSDRGPGIADLDAVLEGRYKSQTGMGIGLIGTRRLVDSFAITSSPEKGTTVVMRKLLPRGAAAIGPDSLPALIDELARLRGENPLDEIQQQNTELLTALTELRLRQEELDRLSGELEDTNRGVMALYAELEEKAEHLRHANEMKTRFLADMSHEFRTPVNSILALSRLVAEGELTAEGHRQITLIRSAALDLATLVNDLLDLAKIEAGMSEMRIVTVEVQKLFSALRGMMRPLLLNREVSLIFVAPKGLPQLQTDEGKISQVLRNFISNALKFTEKGEVRVSVSAAPESNSVIFAVSDTGIGIAEADQERVFADFVQVDSPVQRRQTGTGLGLPLCRKLAALLGGRVWLRSRHGEGSTFFAQIPVSYYGVEQFHDKPDEKPAGKPDEKPTDKSQFEETGLVRLLIIDDDATARYTLSRFAARPGLTIVEATDGMDGLTKARLGATDVAILDLMMPGIGGHEVLQRLKSDPNTSSIPVIIATSHRINDDERGELLKKAVKVISKSQLSRELVARSIDEAMASARGH